jgi:hypothetical protein
MKCELPTSIEIEMFKNAEPSIKSTSQGIVIDSRSENENAFDLMRLSRESFSNEIDKNDSQCEKHNKQRTSTLRGIFQHIPKETLTDICRNWVSRLQ